MPHRLLLGVCVLLLLAGLTSSSAGASPFLGAPGDAPTQLEDAVLDGDLDADDVALRRASRPHALTALRSTAYLALDGRAGTRRDGLREWAGMILVQVPFDGWVARAAGAQAVLSPVAVAPESTLVAEPLFELSPPRSPAAPTAWAEATADRPPAGRASAPLVLSLAVAHECVRAALRAVRLADDERVDALGARARWSATLPELRLRVSRNIDESGRITVTTDDAGHYTEVGGASSFVEARLTFRLDRLLFADEEVAIERLRAERAEVRARTSSKALQALFEWQRAYVLASDATLGSTEHLAALAREMEASALLDVITDGWFGRYRATLPALIL